MAKKKKAQGATPALLAADAAGIAVTVHTFESGHDDFGRQAADALAGRVDPAQIFKTIVVSNPQTRGLRGLGVAMVPATSQVSLKAAAAAFGWPKAELAEAAVAQRATGYVVGGISPVGQKTALPMVIDQSAMAVPTVVVSAGRRGLDMELTLAELQQLTGAIVARIQAE